VASDRIRWSDVDPLGIIRYDTYVRLLEIGETELFRAAGMPYAVIREQLGVWLPRRRLAFEYHAPARLDDTVAIHAFFSAWATRRSPSRSTSPTPARGRSARRPSW
jgi:acyl-CoA thioester hydrolase